MPTVRSLGAIVKQPDGNLDLVLTPPAGIVDDDLLIALVNQNVGTTGWASSGWTALDEVDAQGIIPAIFLKKAASESGNYTFTNDNSNPNDKIGRILAITQGTWKDTGTLSEAINVGPTPSNGASTSATAPAETTDVDGCLLLRFVAVDRDRMAGATPPSGLTNEWHDDSNTGAGACGFGGGHEDQATQGDTGTKIWTITSDGWVGWTIALEPPPGTFTAAVDADVGAITVSADATYIGRQAAVAAAVGAIVADSNATFAPGVSTATAAILMGTIQIVATGTYAGRTAVVGIDLGTIQAAAAATFAPGTSTAIVAAAISTIAVSADATFAPGASSATAAILIGSILASSTAIFAPGVSTAAAAALIGSITVSAAAMFGSGASFTATVAVLGSVDVAAVATSMPPVFTGAVAADIGSVEIVGFLLTQEVLIAEFHQLLLTAERRAVLLPSERRALLMPRREN